MLNNEAISALKDTIDALNLLLEQKERRVRTPAGQRRFKQPIGSVIVADAINIPSVTDSIEDTVASIKDAFDGPITIDGITLHSRVSVNQRSDGKIDIEGVLYSEDPDIRYPNFIASGTMAVDIRVGEFYRSYDPKNKTFELYALQIGTNLWGQSFTDDSRSYMGKGFGREINRRSIEVAEKIGAEKITIDAQADGRIAWAHKKYGFKFSTPPKVLLADKTFADREFLEIRFHSLTDDEFREIETYKAKYDPELSKQLDDIIERFKGPKENWPTPEEILRLGEGKEVYRWSEGVGKDYADTLGKYILRYEGWQGERPVKLNKGAGKKGLEPLEVKERRVRTPEGQRRFGQPIGTVIIADGIGGSVSEALAGELAGQLTDADFEPAPNARLAETLSAAKQLQDEGQGEPVSDPPVDEFADYEEQTYSRHDELLSELTNDQANFVEEWIADFDSVEKFREEALKIFNDEEPGARYYHRGARAGLEMVESSPITDKPLYRGMRLPESASDFKVGDDYHITFGAFTTARNEARQYMDRAIEGGGGKKVEIELEPGARAIPMVGFKPGAIIGEHVTSGRFEIVDVSEDGDITRVKIRHVSTLEPGDLVKKEEVQEALPGMDDPYLLEQEFEDDGQGVLPGMPEAIKRDLIKIVGTGADTDIDYSAFSDVVTPYKPKPISIRSVVRREEREQSLLEIQELDPDAQAYETDTQENGGLFANALSRHSSPFSTSEAKGLVKISVNEQITRRILDHAFANPDFMAWLDNYGYKSMYLGAMRGYNGTTIRYHVPELIPYYEKLTQEEWNAQSAGRDPEKLFWMPGRVNDEEQEYLMIDLGKVPVEIQKKIAKITMLSAALEGSKDPSTGGAINPRTIDYIEKMADSFPYSEVVARFLTRKVIDKWAMTSGDHDRDAVLLQQIAMAKFGLEDVSTDYHLGSYDPVKYKELGLFYEVFVDAMYENTQEFFRENGIKYVNAYRGMKWEPDQVPNWATGGQNIDIEERVNERLEDAIEYYVEEYMSDNESEINDEVQQELDSDFDDFWRGREDEFWEDADFDLEDASELDKDLYRDEKRQEYYEQYWDAIRDRVEESWRENGRQLFYDQGGDSEVRADVMSEFADEMRPTGTIKVESQPLSSWSTNESTAGDFSSESGFYGLVVSGRIPVERIFCTTLTGLGCLNEAEIVVLGDYDELTVE